MRKDMRTVVHPPKLSDQVYGLLKEDLVGDVFSPGQRLVEVDLAKRYGVSRTPVREAMARLSREGLLESHERGYLCPLDTQRDIVDRLEARRLIDTQIARRAAHLAKPEDVVQLQACFDDEKKAHEQDDITAFVEAHQALQKLLRITSRNALMAQCAAMVNDSFQLVRNQIHENKANREKTLECDGKLLDAIRASDQALAVDIMNTFIDSLHDYFGVEKPS
ncbi:transcriptional regulator, GntR family [Teredinibacter turnerae T7901]|uniref:Transcriptional regulator, GntR family n=2 Tax=Teredinibacter turnerae TaxID=2426 RepID=C5BRV6_TERTT|nr:transcriptional regulator, GntR family [Teredinibacter turnerae T7901]